VYKAAVFAFAAAVAAVAVALMLQLLPDSAKLTYGEPLPYLKAVREGDRLKIWLEDFAGLRPERVWLYVNGELKASGGPGTSVYARCGDQVAALAKYEAGVKRVEAEVRCTKPIKAPEGGEATRNYHSYIAIQAHRAATGGVDETDLPVVLGGRCDIDAYNDGFAELSIRSTRPDVLLCVGDSCQQSYSFRWKLERPGSVGQRIGLTVFKTPDASFAQLLGGGKTALDVEVVFEYVSYYNRYDLYLYVNGVLLAECHRETSTSKASYTYTEYQEPNATGVYHTKIWFEGSEVFHGTLVVYQRPDGTFGFKTFLNRAEGEAPEDSSLPIGTRYGTLHFVIDPLFGLEEYFGRGPLLLFYRYIQRDDTARSALADSLYKIQDIEHNVPKTAVNRTVEYLTYAVHASRSGNRYTLTVRGLRISTMGAAVANVYIPLDVKLPPAEMPEDAAVGYVASYK